jgi:hypothetical protein
VITASRSVGRSTAILPEIVRAFGTIIVPVGPGQTKADLRSRRSSLSTLEIPSTMSEHFIRFRVAWDCHFRDGDVEVVRRVDLPTDWPAGPSSPFRLERRFGRPPMDPSAESIRLEMLRVPGLVAARLNGRELAGPDLPGDDWSVPLTDPLSPRNLLVLEVDFRSLPGPPKSWGAVALVISGRPGSPG